MAKRLRVPRLGELAEAWQAHRRAALRTSTNLSSRLAIEALEPRLLLAADTPPISGAIDVPGETDQFSFTLTEPKKIYFDSLANTNAIRWSLAGPNGSVVANRGLAGSDSYDIGGSNVLDLQVGTYTLSVDGDASTTGAYGFRLLDLANAAQIAPGQSVAGHNPGRQTDLYAFDAAAGESFFFDTTLLSGGSVSWRLIDPDGNPVSGPAQFTDSGPFKLDRAGTYTVAIEGRYTNNSAFDYSFNVARVVNSQVGLTIGQTVADTLAGPGSSVTYAFTLASNTRLLFDSLLNVDSYRWTLTGPRGTVVSGRDFRSSDSYDGDPLLALDAGDYKLTVTADADRAGAFAFRLLDTATAIAISPGDTFSATLGNAALVSAGQRPAGAPLDYTGLPGQTNRGWDVALRGSLAVADSAALRPANLTLEAWINPQPGGSYEGIVTKTTDTGWNDGYGLVRVGANLRFFVNNWNGAFVEAPLPVGQWEHVSGTYDGAMLRLYINGVQVAQRAYAAAIVQSQQVLSIGASSGGDYRLSATIDDVRVWNVARTAAELAAAFNAPLDAGQAGIVGYWRFDEQTGATTADLSPSGGTATVARVPATETRFYRMSGTAGANLYFTLNSQTGDDISVRIYKPDGTLLTGPTHINDIELRNLPQTGDYMVVVEGRIYDGSPSSYQYTLANLVDDTAAIALDTTVNGHISAGQRDRYTFTLGTARKLSFDSFTPDGNLNWTLTGPNGVEVSARGFYYSDGPELGASRVLDLQAGDYVLTVDAPGKTVIDYGFRLLDLGSSVAVALDTEVAGRTEPSQETDKYSFIAQAGDVIQLERIVGRNGDNLYWALIDPTGRQVGDANFSSDNVLPIAMTGAYTLLIEGRVWDGGPHDYSFKLHKTGFVTPPDLSQGTALTLGATINGSLAGGGATQLYTFTTTGPKILYFDSMTYDGGKVWTLVGPRGQEVSRAFAFSDSWEIGGNDALVVPAAGTYQIKVSGSAGAYAFRMLDLAAATPVSTANGQVDGILAPNSGTLAYSFTGSKDDTVWFRLTNYADFAFRILDSRGRLLLGPVSLNTLAFTLPATDTYTVLIEGRAYNGGTDDVGFAINRAQSFAPITLVPNTRIDGAIAGSGDTQRYRFTVTAPTTLQFDSLTDNSQINWSMKGPGIVSAAGNFRNSDSYERTTPSSFLVTPGDYEFTVSGNNGAVGAYAFRLLDAASATALPGIGATVSGTLLPASETDMYTFQATAGERFSFAATQIPGYANVRLLDPFGRDATGAFDFTNTSFTTAFTGRYSLLIEGRPWDTTSQRPYAFSLDRPVDPAPVTLTIGQTATATILRPSETSTFTFTLAQAGRFYFDSQTPSTDVSWTLSGPSGVVRTSQFYYSDSYENYAERTFALAAGSYTIKVNSANGAVGPNSFRLLDLAAAQPITFATPISSSLTPASETDTYSFTATAGDNLFLQVTQGLPYASLRIIDPSGHQIANPVAFSNYEFAALQSGTYTVLVEGRVWDGGVSQPYTFAMYRSNSTVQAIDIAGTTGQSSLRPGKVGNALSMSGTEQVQVFDPALDIRDQVTVEFWINPDRAHDTWVPVVYKGDATQRTYTLWFNANASILLSSVSTAGEEYVQTPGGSVPYGQWTHVAAVLDRTAGTEKIYLNGVLSVSRTISGNQAYGSPDTPLYISGTSQLDDSYGRLEGALDEVRVWHGARTIAQIQADMLNGQPAVATGLVARLGFDSLTPGGATPESVSGSNVQVLRDFAGLPGTVEGKLAVPGDRRTYTFTLNAATMLEFDALYDNDQIGVTITGPGGVSISRNLRNGDSFELGGENPVFAAPAGQYTVVVDGNSATTGTFAFRFLDLGTAPHVALGSAISTTIVGGRENQAYKFDVTPGQRIIIDAQAFSTSTDRVSLRLIDPYGKQVVGPVTFTDIDTGVLAVGGTYSLLVEGRAWRDWPIDYRIGFYLAGAVGAPTAITLDGVNPVQPHVEPGKNGNALSLTGVEYIEVPNAVAPAPVRDFTLEGWYRLDRMTDNYVVLVSKGDADTQAVPYHISVRSDGQLGFVTGDSSGNQGVSTAPGAFTFGEWVHVAAVVDRTNGTQKIFVNGVEAASSAIRTNDNVVNSAPLLFGKYAHARTDVGAIEGAIDTVRMLSGVRTAAQITADMGAPPATGAAGVLYALDFESATLPGGAILRAMNPNGVTGKITNPGEEKLYTFTLSAPKTVYFDSETNTGALQWSLTGPNGAIVDNRRFDQSDSIDFGPTPALQLAAGTYTLKVNGLGDGTGNYNFRLTDLAAATALILNTSISVALDPAKLTNAYKFAAQAGEKFYFDAVAVASEVYWRLLDPSGKTVFGPTGLNDIDGLALAVAGTYTLLVEGRVHQGSEASYTIGVYNQAPSTIPLTLGAKTDAVLATPGASNRYTFTLAQPAKLLFDTLSADRGFNWTLTGPSGTVVDSRNFVSTDSFDYGGDPVLNLAAGNWVLTVDAPADNTGHDFFRLLDLASAEVLTPGATLNRTLANNGHDTTPFKFTATEGMRFGFTANQVSGNNSWRLIDPLGQVVFGPSYMSDTGLLTAAMAGTYTLLVEGRIYNNGDLNYSFRYDQPVLVPAGGQTAQTFDSAGLPYQLVNHAGAAAQVLTGTGGNFVRLTDVLHSNVQNSAVFSATGSGRQDSVDLGFDFRIARQPGATTDPDGISFAFLPVAQYGISGPGPVVGIEANVPGALGLGFDTYDNGEVNANHVSIHYNGVKIGEIANPGIPLASGAWNHARVQLTRTTGGTLLTLTLTPTGGSAVTAISNFFIGGMELEAGRVLLSAQEGSSLGDQDIDNVSVAMTPAAAAAPALPLDTTISGDIALPGAENRYGFTITQPTAVVFDSLTNNGALRWQILGPTQTGGVRYFNGTDSYEGGGANPVMVLQPGSYQMIVSASTTNTGSYAFRLASLSSAQAVVSGQPQTVTLNPGTSTALFKFDAVAGQKVYFDAISGSGEPYWRLIDPAGNQVFGPNYARYDIEAPVLPIDGTYTLMIEGRIWSGSPQTLTFAVDTMVDTAAALTIGATTSGAIVNPGDRTRYSFTLAQDSRLMFDSLLNHGGMNWTLTGPTGTIDSRYFNGSDAFGRGDNEILYAPAGTYTLTVDADIDYTGPFSFRLLDLTASASPLPIDVATTGQLNPGNASKIYTFTGAPGDRMFFDYLSTTGYGTWRLLDPTGKVLFNVPYQNDAGPVTLPRAGVYTLLFDGRVDEPVAVVDYTFKVTKIVDKTAALTLGQTFTGTLDLPRQSQLLTFTLANPATLFVDAFNNYGDVSWTLDGPPGTVDSRAFNASDSWNYGPSPVLKVPAGTYTLRVTNNGSATRPFSIRVSDTATATPITPGVPVSGTLSPGSEAKFYKFDATAGERFFFDQQAQSGISSTWRLIGPSGNQLFHSDFNTDVDTMSLPDAGTYTLIIDGYIAYDNAVGTYTFNVFENTLQSPIVINALSVKPAPDLAPTALAVTATGQIVSGGTVTLAWKTTNSGTRPTAADWTDRIIVRNLDTGEIIGNILIADTAGALDPGAERQRQTTITLPDGNRGTGRISFTVTSDVANTISEDNILGTAESNNSASVEVVSVLAPFIDLTVSNVVPEPTSGWAPGDTVTLRWTTTNAGNRATATGMSERVTIRNTTSNQQFTLVDVPLVAPIGAGISVQRSATVIWPAGLTAHGAFDFTVTTDILDQIVEANAAGTGETNNAASASAISSPDLVIRNFAIANPSPAAGDTVTLNWDEANAGNAATLGGWTNRVLVERIDTGEVLLDLAVPTATALAAGQQRSRTFAFTLPQGQRAVGNIRVTVVADSDVGGAAGTVREVVASINAEGNNAAGGTLTVAARNYPDLRVTAVSAPASAVGSNPITVTWTVTNAGAADTGTGWSDRVVLSTDAIFGNGDDVVLGNFARGSALAAGGQYTGTGSVVLPGNLAGTYRIFVAADPAATIIEPDTRADNVGAPASIVLTSQAPNLVTEAVFGPAGAVVGGQPFTVSWRVRNTGTVAAPGGHTDRLVLSADDIYDAGDLVLGEVVRSGALAAGDSYSVSFDARVQDGRTGSYKLILVTDSGQQVFENLLEADNIAVSTPITLSPAPSANLVVQSVSVPAGAIAGQTVAVTYVVKNTGAVAAAAPWTDTIYFGTDTIVANARNLVSVTRTFALDPGASYTVTQDVTLPTDFADGDSRVLVRTDSGHQVFEAGQEADNDGASAVLGLTHPDLVVSALSGPAGGTAISGSTFDVSWTVRNAGSGTTAAGWTDTVWLSRDGVIGAGDIKLGSVSAIGALAAGATRDAHLTVTLPIDVQGAYKLIVRTDDGDVVAETTGETNNTTAIDLAVGLAPYADLVVSNVTAPARTISDPAHVTVGWRVTNSGTGAGITSSWADSVIVSSDDVFGNGDDIVLGELVHSGALALGASYNASLDLILPPGFYGHYTLFVRSDSRNVVFENGADGNRGFLTGPFDVSPIPWADLVVNTVVAPASGASGTDLTVSWTVGNQGIGLTNVPEWFDTVLARKD